MPEAEFETKRAHTRFIINIPLTYSSLGINKTNQGQTQDISAKGIGFLAEEELIPQTSLDVCLNMQDNGEQVHIKAEVIWSKKIQTNKYRVGVNLKDKNLKPIPLVLRTIQSRL